MYTQPPELKRKKDKKGREEGGGKERRKENERNQPTLVCDTYTKLLNKSTHEIVHQSHLMSLSNGNNRADWEKVLGICLPLKQCSKNPGTLTVPGYSNCSYQLEGVYH